MSAAPSPSPSPSHAALAWAVFDTPVGPCGLAWDDTARLAGSQLPEADTTAMQARMRRRFGPVMAAPPAFVQAWIDRLRAVMAGADDRLADIVLADESAAAFQRRVWALARQIAPGQTRSYGEIAVALGEPAAARAVGQALGANPFAPFVPCHRVLAARGAAGGFSAPGGQHTKLRLLQLEGARFEWQPDQPGLF